MLLLWINWQPEETQQLNGAKEEDQEKKKKKEEKVQNFSACLQYQSSSMLQLI